MSFNLSLQSEALLEIKEAFEWYEEQSNGLGYEFLDELEICYQQIAIHPERYSFVNQYYRRIKTKRFPYILIFEVFGDDIVINSVRHIKREPFSQ